jgi:Domain of unknown function (DUF4337)
LSEELHELHEHAEHARHNPSLAPVSLTMAILAVLVAVVSLLGHRSHTEEILLQSKASDQWAYYQAKNIRRHTDEVFADLTAITNSNDPGALGRIRDKYKMEADRYKDEQTDIQAEARHLEDEVLIERRRANRFDLGEVFLEIALVVTSITLLSGRRAFWYFGLVLGVVGMVVATTGLLIH